MSPPEKDKIFVYSEGACLASVCAPKNMSNETILAQMPSTGIKSQWKFSEEKTFKGGQPNPCQCNLDETRQHHLMFC